MAKERVWKMEVWEISCSRAPCALPDSVALPAMQGLGCLGWGRMFSWDQAAGGTELWERAVKCCFWGSPLCLGAKLRPLTLALAWATLEECLCLALILTFWHDLRPALLPGPCLCCDRPWLGSPDLPCSPCLGTVTVPWLVRTVSCHLAVTLVSSPLFGSHKQLAEDYFFSISDFYLF